jgi:hypothetical protein
MGGSNSGRPPSATRLPRSAPRRDRWVRRRCREGWPPSRTVPPAAGRMSPVRRPSMPSVGADSLAIGLRSGGKDHPFLRPPQRVVDRGDRGPRTASGISSRPLEHGGRRWVRLGQDGSAAGRTCPWPTLRRRRPCRARSAARLAPPAGNPPASATRRASAAHPRRRGPRNGRQDRAGAAGPVLAGLDRRYPPRPRRRDSRAVRTPGLVDRPCHRTPVVTRRPGELRGPAGRSAQRRDRRDAARHAWLMLGYPLSPLRRSLHDRTTHPQMPS